MRRTHMGGRRFCARCSWGSLPGLTTSKSLGVLMSLGSWAVLISEPSSQNLKRSEFGLLNVRIFRGRAMSRPSIEALLKAKADVSRASSLGETPLGEAAGQGPPELVARLLEAWTGQWSGRHYLFNGTNCRSDNPGVVGQHAGSLFKTPVKICLNI